MDQDGTAGASSRCLWGMTGRIIEGRVEFVCSTCSYVTTASSANDFVMPSACPRAVSIAVGSVFGLVGRR